MVNALVKNLEEADYRVTETPFQVKEIGQNQKAADIIIIYADGEIASYQSTLVYLRDLCLEENRLLVLVGNREEIQHVCERIPEHLLTAVFERPLDVNAFIERVNSVLDEESLEQRKKSILIVDDDAGYLQLLREWLKEDYRVGMAKSGMQAITWLARNNVDLILLDYEMPVTSGLQVFEMLKSEPFSKDIPVMFLTGKSDRETILRVMEMKPAGYMLKNITKFKLLAYLDNFFVGQKYNM